MTAASAQRRHSRAASSYLSSEVPLSTFNSLDGALGTQPESVNIIQASGSYGAPSGSAPASQQAASLVRQGILKAILADVFAAMKVRNEGWWL